MFSCMLRTQEQCRDLLNLHFEIVIWQVVKDGQQALRITGREARLSRTIQDKNLMTTSNRMCNRNSSILINQYPNCTSGALLITDCNKTICTM